MRGTVRIAETMVNDLLLEMGIRKWKQSDLYQPVDDDNIARGHLRRDPHAMGSGHTELRMLGAPALTRKHGVSVERACRLIEELLKEEGPGMAYCRWPAAALGEWKDDPDLREYPEGTLSIELYSHAALTSGNLPRLEATSKAAGEINNSFFSIGLDRRTIDEAPEQQGQDVMWSLEHFPPVMEHLMFDNLYYTFCCQVSISSGAYESFLAWSDLPCCTCEIRQRCFSWLCWKGGHLYGERYATFGSQSGCSPLGTQIYGTRQKLEQKKQLSCWTPPE